MIEDETDKDKTEANSAQSGNVLPFKKPSETAKNSTGKPANDRESPDATNNKAFPASGTVEVTADEPDPNERELVITLQDGDVRFFSGYVGLTGSFLAVGKKDGSIKYAANNSRWAEVEDITDLEDGPEEVFLFDGEKPDAS